MPAPQDRDTVTQPESITPQRFAQVRAIFEAAIERPVAERRAFAAGACSGDRALLREVEAMLAADEQADSPPSPSTPEEGRFPAGTVLAGRYRILGLLGHGGMGEVYKAFDLILNQTVALKFLAPAHISEAALVRFRNEVRIARQVSHPNVCRVYDLGMVEGLHFLSMEYIDGEDMASLLRRIGRLPQDKAIEFTRKICAGLSAAHERGVLHRDLKPANIMIDGRGQVRITDFGLAGLAAEIPLSDLRSGTPAYMSPEQKAGREVTARSDIYSLGLVLHEMFTGKARHETQSNPSDLIKDLDPTLERLILRCLEEDPKRRPQTALSVAMALPGADPIAAALAAGETPSPEMVAASSEKEGFRPRTAVLCFAAIVLSLLLGVPLAKKTTLLGIAPLEVPPDVLTYRAQELLKNIGYTESPAYTAHGFDCCDQQAIASLPQNNPGRRDEILASHWPPVVSFWYRQHLREFDVVAPFQAVGAIGPDTPPNTDPGMIRVVLNANGRLLRLDVHPWEARGESRQIDWEPEFAAAGLDPKRFQSTTPARIPPMSSDAQTAWTGTDAGHSEPVRIEAASWRGRPVYFEVRPLLPALPAITPYPLLESNAFLILLFFCIAGAVLTAHRNIRVGRVDRRGAAVFAGAGFLVAIGAFAFGAYHVAGIWEIALVTMGLSWASFVGGAIWIFYIAIEPYVRRNWPDSLISWSRLCSGQSRNALVASHILAGLTAAEVYTLVANPGMRALLSNVDWIGHTGLNSVTPSITVMIGNVQLGLAFALGMVLIVVLVRLLIRKVWLADLLTAFLLSFSSFGVFGGGSWHTAAAIAFFTAATSVWIWLLRHFGFLTLVVFWVAGNLSFFLPLVASGWLAGPSIGYQLIPVAVAAWALWVIASNQKKPSADPAI